MVISSNTPFTILCKYRNLVILNVCKKEPLCTPYLFLLNFCVCVLHFFLKRANFIGILNSQFIKVHINMRKGDAALVITYTQVNFVLTTENL